MHNHQKNVETVHLFVNKLPITMEEKSLLDFLQIELECSRNDVLTDYNRLTHIPGKHPK